MRIMAGGARLARRLRVAFDRLQIFFVVAVTAQLQEVFDEQRRLRRLMRLVAAGAILHHIMLEFRLLQEIIMAIPAQGRRGFFHERFLVGRVRIMTGHAVAVTDGLMDHFGIFGRNVVVTTRTEVFHRLLQQLRDFGGVRRVTFQAIAIAHGLMHKFFPADEVGMAIQAGVPDGFFQQTLEIRGVGRMAIGAIAAFNGLMLELADRQRVIMAVQTKRIPPGDEQFLIQRGMRLVTALAIALRKRRMTDLADQQIGFDPGVAVEADLTGLAAHPVRELRLVANATLTPGIGGCTTVGGNFKMARFAASF